jgi:hypothetical protein
MATKKKSKKKTTKSKKTTRKTATPAKTVKRPKKVAKKKPIAKRAGKQSAEKKKASGKKQTRKKESIQDPAAFSLNRPRSRASEEESGDLQGLSRVEGADSESVDELLEEGNAFEADVVSGVESADNADEQEVHTHEVPEDDVPGEYLDED